jgi:metal-sulfur cluster biosynthetic enzyme
VGAVSERRLPPLSKDTPVVDLLARMPAAVAVMIGYGFFCLADTALRRVIPADLTLGAAAAIHGVDPDVLLGDLRRAVEHAPDGETLPEGTGAAGPVPNELPLNAGDVLAALRRCYDPEVSVNIVDLGLIRDVRMTSDRILVEMTLRRENPRLAGFLTLRVREAVRSLGKAQGVEVRLVWEPAWRPSHAAPVARRALGWTDDDGIAGP